MAFFALVASGLLIVASGRSVTENSNVAAGKEAARDSVISKVIEMLGKNKDQIKLDIQAETKEMEEYFDWCDDEQKESGYQIKTATRKIEELNALISDRKAGMDALDESIAELASEITDRNTERDEANALRKQQNEDFKKNEEEQMGMVEELEQMEQELKRQMEAMTTPPPVPVEGEGDAPVETGLVDTSNVPSGGYDSLLQVKHAGRGGGKANRTNGKKHATMTTLRMAMEKMVNSIWRDPQSKKALGTVSGLLQQQMGEDPAEAPATVEIGADAMQGMQDNTANNLGAFEMLKGKAEESLQRMRDAEVQEKHNHDLRLQALMDAIHLAEDKKEEAHKDHTRLGQEKGEAEGELTEVTEAKAAAEKYLESVSNECAKATHDWDARLAGAKDEMGAIEKAKEILASRVNVFVQAKLRAKLAGPDDASDSSKAQAKAQKARQHLINHFRTLGTKMKSMAMLNLVSVASEEPLGQVKGLISDLVTKLEKEAAEAASLHAFCQEEKAKTKAQKEKKTNRIEKLDARLDKAMTKKTELEEANAGLSNEIAEMDAADAEALKIRTEEHETNTKAIADYKEAADAVSDASDALKDYYGEFVQIQSNVAVKGKAPPKLGGAKSDAAGGILSIMDTMQEEFQKTAAQLTSTEREAQKAYDTLKQENRVSKAAKKAEIKGNESEIKSLTVAIHNFQEDHKMASNELDSVNEYIEKLKPQCQGRTVSYAERKAKREAEIQGLKDALSILESDAPAVFAQVRGHLRRASSQ